MVGSDRRFVAVNPAFQKMTGYSEAELRLLSPVDITHDDDQSAAEAIVATSAAARSYEKRYRRKDGGVIWAAIARTRTGLGGPSNRFGGPTGPTSPISWPGAERCQPKRRSWHPTSRHIQRALASPPSFAASRRSQRPIQANIR